MGSKKIALVSLLVIIIAFVLSFAYFRLTFYSIYSWENVELPSVENGSEENYFGYKYSNTSGIIVSTKPEIHCEWKPDNEDDGWKKCEAIFEIENHAKRKVNLNIPKLNVDFLHGDVRNVHFAYSTDYSVETENVLVSDDGNVADIATGPETKTNYGLVGNAILEENSEKTPEPINLTVVELRKRRFQDFKEFSIEENISYANDSETSNDEINNQTQFAENQTSEEQIEVSQNSTTVSEETALENNNSTESLQNFSSENYSESNLTNDEQFENFSDNSSDSLVESESNATGLSLTGFVSQENDDAIDTSKPFAIQVTFEIPKYSFDQFDFAIQDEGFFALIDPAISTCGSLTSPNSVYTLGQDIASNGSCFFIEAQNVTLDCSGHTINFALNSSGSGISVDSYSGLIVRNCNLNSPDFSQGNRQAILAINSNRLELKDGSIGVYGEENNLVGVSLSNSSNTIFTNISMNLNGNIVQGFSILDDSTQLNLSNSQIYASGSVVYSVFAETSSNLSIYSSRLNSSGSTGSYNINFGYSEYSQVKNNLIFANGSDGYNLLLANSSYSTIQNNSVINENNNGAAIQLTDLSNGVNVEKNLIQTVGGGVYAFYMESSNELNFTTNNIATSGNFSMAVKIVDSNNNVFSQNNITTVGLDSFAFYFIDTGNMTIERNKASLSGDEAYGVWITSSNFNNFSSNEFNISGETASAFRFDEFSQRNIVQGNSMYLPSYSGYGFEFEDTHDNSISENSIIIGGSDGRGIDLYNSPNNSFYSNNFTIISDQSRGAYVDTGSENTRFHNLIINTSGDDSAGIIVKSSMIIEDCTVTTIGSRAYALQINSDSDLNVSDSSLHANSESTSDLYIDDGVNGFWNFTNVSFTDKYSENLGANGFLHVWNYLSGQTLNASQDVLENVNVTFADTFNNSFFSTTDVLGYTSTFLLPSYIQNSSSTKYYYPYTILAILNESDSKIKIVNLTESLLVKIIFSNEEINQNSGSSGGISSQTRNNSIAGSSPSCESLWSCTDWSVCSNGFQNRVCTNPLARCEQTRPSEQLRCRNLTREFLFDIAVELLKDTIPKNNKLTASVSLINLGVNRIVDANLKYAILNSDNQIVFKETETVPVETQTEFVKTLDVSKLEGGKYRLVVDLSYEGQLEPARSVNEFEISSVAMSPVPYTSLFTFGVLVCGAIMVSLLWRILKKSY